MTEFYIDSNGQSTASPHFYISSENFFAENKDTKPHFGNALRRSVAAGVLIGLACVVYLSCSNQIVGSFLFSFGLMTVCATYSLLFTGKAAFAKSLEDHLRLAFIWFGNALGVAAIAVPVRLCYPEVEAQASEVLNGKVNLLIQQIILGGVLCGMIMYLAVSAYRNREGVERYLWIFMGVPLFLISGYDHSIADMFYVIVGSDEATAGAGLLLVGFASVANYVGARVARWLL